MKPTTLMLTVLVLLVGAGEPAIADVITSIPNGTVVPMTGNYGGPGPLSFGSGITWTSNNPWEPPSGQEAYFGWTATELYFGSNGNWNGALGGATTVGTYGNETGAGITYSMTFAFATPQSAVGGFMNYLPGGTSPTTIAVYNSADQLIETYNLSFLTGGGTNTGQFMGFQESTADISYFTLSNNYITITDLTVAVPAPEPSTLTLLGTALATLSGYVGWRRACGSQGG